MEIDAAPKTKDDQKSLRLVVEEVTRLGPQQVQLLVKHDDKTDCDNNDLMKVRLEGVWTQLHIAKRSIVHLLNPQFDKENKTLVITNHVGFIVVEPDNLYTCTLIASSLFCERKAWLDQVFSGVRTTNRAMLVGTLVHEVFQYGVKHKIADMSKLNAKLYDLLDDANVMMQAYSIGLHLDDIRNEAMIYLPSVLEWVEKFMLNPSRQPLTNAPELEVKVIGVSDIEENVWSTKYGLKGKIDVTAAVRVYNSQTKSLADKIIPLELKSGNPVLSQSHSAQVSLYSMMIEDRYAETNQGFVIYLKDKAAMHNVALTHPIKRDLIQRRNQVNFHSKSHFVGPEMLDQPRMCKGCDRLTECIMMSNIYDPGKIEEYPSMKSLEAEATGHLNAEFFKFFKAYHEKIASILTKNDVVIETNGDSKGRKCSDGFWNYSSKEAEARGTGFGRLQRVPSDDPNSPFITFKRHPKFADDTDNDSNEIVIQDTVDCTPTLKKQKISDFFKPVKEVVKPGSQKRSKPFNTNLSFDRYRIAISSDDETYNMDKQNSSTAILIGFIQELKSDSITMRVYDGSPDIIKNDGIYRIDRIEKKPNLDLERAALVGLLAREDWRSDRIRQLLLDPKFVPKENVELNLSVLSAEFEEISELDAKQQKFVVEAVSTDNYFIMTEAVETNKSKVHKTISVLTRIINNLSRNVLIVAQNIDHLVDLMRILTLKKVKFIIIDDSKSVKARRQFSGNLVKLLQDDSFSLKKRCDAYIRQHEQAQVVITTYAMALGGYLCMRRTFDYCVAYDCDKTELLLALSPMFCSDRFIIIDVNDTKNVTDPSEECNVTLGVHLRRLRP